MTGEVKTHLCVLLAAIAITIATGFWLDRFSLLYSETGVVFGAGYTDVHARLQAYWLMGFVTVAVAVLFMLAIWRSGFSLPVFGIGLYLGVLLLLNGLYPWFQQKLCGRTQRTGGRKPLHRAQYRLYPPGLRP